MSIDPNEFSTVYPVIFNGFYVDPTSSRFDLNIEFETIPKTTDEYEQSLRDESDKSVGVEVIDGEDDTRINRLAISKKIDIKYKDDEVSDLVIKRSMSMASYAYNTYTPETAFLIPSVDVLTAAEELFEQGVTSVGVLKKGRDFYVGEATQEIDLTIDVEANDKASRSKAEIKGDLKAYETPTNIHDINLSLMQHSIVKAFQPRAIEAIVRSLIKAKVLDKKEMTNKTSSAKVHSQVKVILHCFDANGWSSSTLSRDEIASASLGFGINMFASSSMFDKEINELADILMDKDEENMMLYSGLFDLREQFPFLHFEKGSYLYDEYISKVDMPILDLQAGSAAAYFQAFDHSNTNAKVIGTELRNAEEMPVEDERYHVMQGANFALFKSAYENVFENKNNRLMVRNIFSYLNPPYTSDDSIAKESVMTLGGEMLVTGLFPTKMLPFLRNTISGYLFNIPKELTGYTDANTPERFIYVVGKKYDKNIDVAKGVTARARNITHQIDTTDIKSATIMMRGHMNAEDKFFDYGFRIRHMVDYYLEKPERTTNIQRHLDERFQRTKALLSQASVLQDALQANKETILGAMSPIEVLKTERVFPELREFVEDGHIESYTFKDIASNIPLLVYYRDNHPAIFDLVLKTAEEIGTEVPVEPSSLEPFSLSDPKESKHKDKITSEFLGMMKLYYYPSLIDLGKDDDKSIFVDIVSSVLRQKNEESGEVGNDTLGEQVEVITQLTGFASKVVVKNQAVVQSGTYLAKEEVFVLVDKYENDIAKLDISLTDFYHELEERRIFDLYDYVELAQLGSDEKKTIVSSFLDHIGDILVMISDYSGIPIDTDKPISNSEIFKMIQASQMQRLKVTADLKKKKISVEEFHAQQTAIYVDISRDLGLDKFFKEQLIMPDSEKEAKGSINRNTVLLEYLADESNDFDKPMLGRLAKSVAHLFTDKELHFFESDSTSQYLSDLLNMAGVTLDIERFNDFTTELFDALAPIYTIRNSLISGETRFARILIEDYFKMFYFKNIKGMSPEAVYDKYFKRMMIQTMGLKPHQFSEAERFTSISDETKLELLFWEMRSGKSRAFIAIVFMLSMLNKDDASLLLETKNIQDIATQMLESFPFMFFGLNVFGNKSSTDIKLNPNLMFNSLDADIFPNIPKLLQDNFIGRGDMAIDEMSRFTQNFEKLLGEVEQRLDDDEISIEELKAEHADSLFVSILDACEG